MHFLELSWDINSHQISSKNTVNNNMSWCSLFANVRDSFDITDVCVKITINIEIVKVLKAVLEHVWAIWLKAWRTELAIWHSGFNCYKLPWESNLPPKCSSARPLKRVGILAYAVRTLICEMSLSANTTDSSTNMITMVESAI